MVYDKRMEPEFDIVRSYDAFVNYISEKGLPYFISFDNDLGLNEKGEIAPDGYAAAKWLVYESGLNLQDLEFKVHSANPVATEQIIGLLSNYIEHERVCTFLEKIDMYCSEIYPSNFSSKYDGLKKIVIDANKRGLSKTRIIKELNGFILSKNPDEYIEEVVSEVLNCVVGYTHPSNILHLT